MSLPIFFIHLDDLGNIAAAVAAGATVLLLIAAIWAGKTAQAQIAEQRRIEMRRRAYDHLGIFNSRDFTEMSAEAARVFQLFKEEKTAHKTIWTKLSDSERTSVQTFLNFYEEIASEYNAGFLDRTAAEPLVFVTVIMWQRSRELAEWLRRGDRRYLEQWERLYRDNAPAILSVKETQ
jgi:poly-beta-hydroxyalkanoate depolymerase